MQQAPTTPNTNRTNTSTQIRNFYAEGVSYMNTKFYNTSFAISLYPFTGKDENGRSTFDKTGVSTTISYEGAAALSYVCQKIIEGNLQEASLSIPCFNASMVLEHRPNASGQPETVLVVTKNNMTVTYPFSTTTVQVKENGVPQTQIIPSGLISFKHTLDGYLGGVNADRHLDKFTEEYTKTLGSLMPQNQQPKQNFQKNNYQNNNNGYRGSNRQQYQPRNNGNPNFNQPKQNNWGPAQNFDNYNVPN